MNIKQITNGEKSRHEGYFEVQIVENHLDYSAKGMKLTKGIIQARQCTFKNPSPKEVFA